MSADRSERRKPRAFAPDDPSIVREPEPERPPIAPGEAPPTAASPARPAFSAPTLEDLQSGFRWGALLFSALVAATTLAATVWFARFVSVALSRDDWVGWLMTGLMGLAAFAALMLFIREVVGFARLSRLGRMKKELAAALASTTAADEKRAIAKLTALYAGRPEHTWGIARMRDHLRDVHDPGALARLAERELLAPLDVEARRLITKSAKRVATVTALSPMMFLAVGYVLIENLRMLRALATLYGGRPGPLGALRLARLVFTHIVATGGIAMTDDLLGQFLGQDVLRRLSRRLGEGAFNGALTGRIGVAAVDVCRPLAFLDAKPIRLRDVAGEVLRRSGEPEPVQPAR
jgi:putative membrane protein